MGNLHEMNAEELIKRLKDYCDDPEAKFAFFLGAGCSVSSGIPAAGCLVKDQWLPKLYRYEKRELEFDAWVMDVFPDYDPQNPALIYGKVIDRLFPLPQQRQDEIERICKGVLPGFGYGVLAELIAKGKNKFNAIVTTNFDNLIADAMYLFTNNHPLVITHASLVSFIRPTMSKPLIVKLHHDAQLGPRNNEDETSEIDSNMQKRFSSIMYDRGLIFIGYGGNDPGVNQMLESMPEDALPYGVYWVNGEEPQEEIRTWLEKREAFWINNFDFDEFMLIIKKEFEIADPNREHIEYIFKNYFQKLNELSSAINKRKESSTNIKILDDALKSAIDGITDPIGYYLKALSLEKENPDLANQVYNAGLKDYPSSADVTGCYARFLHYVRNDYDKAEEFYEHAMELNSNLAWNLGNYASFLHDIRKDYNRAEGYYQKSLELNPDDAIVTGEYARFLHNVRLDYDKAEEYYKKALELDPDLAWILRNYASFILEFRNNIDKADELYSHALELESENSNGLGNYSGFLFVNGKKEKGLKLLNQAIDLIDEKEYPGLSVELWFYAFIQKHETEKKKSLEELKKSLLKGIRSDFFLVTQNAEVAKKEGNKDSDWIEKLAKVIREQEDISILDNWPAWREV